MGFKVGVSNKSFPFPSSGGLVHYLARGGRGFKGRSQELSPKLGAAKKDESSAIVSGAMPVANR